MTGLKLVEPLIYLGTGLTAAAALVGLAGKNHRPRARSVAGCLPHRASIVRLVLGGFTLALARRSGHRAGVAGILMALGLVLPVLAFIEMFPLPRGFGFLLPGLGAGFAAGTWSSREQLPESMSR